VFECELTAPQLELVARQLRMLIDLDTDSVRCYLLDEAAKKRIRIVGIGRVTVDPTYYVVGGDRTAPER
jgi:CRISPR-associated protein Cas2